MGSIDEARIPQRGDLAQKFREGVSKESLGEFSGGDDAGRLTGRVALTINVTIA
jgi:hypothetical protein